MSHLGPFPATRPAQSGMPDKAQAPQGPDAPDVPEMSDTSDSPGTPTWPPTRSPRRWATPAVVGMLGLLSLLTAALPAWTAAAGTGSTAAAPASSAPSAPAEGQTAGTATAPSATATATPPPTAATTAATTTAPTDAPAEARPVLPSGAISSITLPAGPACRAPVKPPCIDPTPLSLDRQPETLPRGRQAIAYLRVLQAEGGQEPYLYTLADGQLPAGIALSPQGLLSGTPTQAQRTRFVVRVRDAAGRQAQQTYLLQVLPAPGDRPARPATGGASSALQSVDLKSVASRGLPRPDMVVYQLQPAQLDELKLLYAPAEAASAPDGASSGTAAASTNATTPTTAPNNTAAGSPPPEQTTPPAPKVDWSEAQQAQMQHWLAPVMGVEYPSRALFLAAVESLACQQADELLNIESHRTGRPREPRARGAKSCEQGLREAREQAETPVQNQGKAAAPRAQASAPSAAPSMPGSASSPAKTEPGSLPAAALPQWLLPPRLAIWLGDAAAQPRTLDPLPRAASAVWKAEEGCACVNSRERQTLYAIAPTWQPEIDAQALDFSLIHRFTSFAFTLPQLLQRKATPPGEDPDLKQRLAFVETARRYDTRVDLGLYHQDWSFLGDSLPQERDRYVQRLLDDVPRQARLWLDAPLPGASARWKAHLPFFSQVQHLGDGLTVYFDNTPKDEKSVAFRNFADFYPQFVRRVASAMGENPQRSYSINLLLNLDQIRDGGAMSVAKLFELLKAVEKPEVVNGRIVETHTDYKRNSNVVLRFLVFLPEPSTDSKKQLRRLIEESPALKGGDRRIFLRSVVPVLVLPQRDAQQYEDDLVYVQDNFDGIGFWPAPLIDSQITAEQRHTLRRVFVTDPPSSLSESVCSVVCPQRWALRVLLELLLLAGALTWLAFQWNCEWRAKYGQLALLAGIPPVIVGAALLQCDPALAGIRNSNAQLLALIAIPVIAALVALLKRKVEKP